MLIEDRKTKRNLVLTIVVLFVGVVGISYLLMGLFAKAQTPPLQADERPIPEDVIKYYESKVGEKMEQLAIDYEPIQKRLEKANPYQQEIFVLAANKLGIDPAEWPKYMIDYKKKALVKRPQQPVQPQPAR